MRVISILVAVLLLAALLTGAAADKHTVVTKKCIGCGLCKEVCPTGAITITGKKAVIDPETCVNCGLCIKKCPVNAIRPPENTKKQPEKKPAPKKKKSSEQTAEKIFRIDPSRCTGCRECIPVCPVSAITLHGGKAVIDPEACISCGKCSEVCAFSAPEKTLHTGDNS